MWQVREEAWQQGFSSSHEALKDFLLSNPRDDLSLLDLDAIIPSPATLEVGAQVRVDLAPTAFQAVPVAASNPPGLGPVESKEVNPNTS